jgi:isopenicillin-N N-acyltransferase-like protein
MTLRVPASADGPAATLLTVTGCLGMAGMSEARVGIAINNLFSTDATLGVVWPAMVRRALHQPTAAAARDLIATSPIGSGHHYFVADRTSAYAIEASGTRRKQIFSGGSSFCHTNHRAPARQRRRLAAQHLHEPGDARSAARRGDLRRDRDEPR